MKRCASGANGQRREEIQFLAVTQHRGRFELLVARDHHLGVRRRDRQPAGKYFRNVRLVLGL